MNDLKKFLDTESGIVIRVAGTPERPLFVAKDVCDVLGIANSRDAINELDQDERDDVGITDTIGRQQQMSVVTESGLYALVFKSRKPEAKAFRKWVTGEVLPSIRKTGSFTLPASMRNVSEGIDMVISSVGRLIAMGVPPGEAMRITDMGEHFLSNLYKNADSAKAQTPRVKGRR